MAHYNFLLLEDDFLDAELIVKKLRIADMSFTYKHVDNRHSFETEISTGAYSAILADNSLPQFNAMEALEICRAKNIEIPFILITGSVSEEYAAEVMKAGAWDYILKDRLQRLPASIENAISKYEANEDRKHFLQNKLASEALLKEAEQIAHYGSWEVDLETGQHRWSDELYRIMGYAAGEMMPNYENFICRIHPGDTHFVQSVIENAIKFKVQEVCSFRLVVANGFVKYVSAGMVVKRSADGKAVKLNGFMHDITELKVAERLEEQVTADLIRRNQDLERFSYIVSHNLRAPVANIVGITHLLTSVRLGEAEHTEYLDDLSVTVAKLDGIIRDISDILHTRSNVNENKEFVVFADLVADITQSMNLLIADSGAIINANFAEVEGMPSLKSHIHSVFFNLISNSIKFRRRAVSPVINIRARRLPSAIVLSFADNGIGIDLQKHGRLLFGLYNRFQADHAEGKGMGLFMVKTQVEALGGRIEVSSVVNEGTEFHIELPLSN